MLKDQILGVWSLTTVSDVHSDGRKENPWGPTVKGAASFDNKGRFTWIIIGADLAPSGRSQVSSRMAPAYFGAYTVDEASKTVTYTLEGSTAPQFDGVVRKGVVSITGSEMKHVSAPISDSGRNRLSQSDVQAGDVRLANTAASPTLKQPGNVRAVLFLISRHTKGGKANRPFPLAPTANYFDLTSTP